MADLVIEAEQEGDEVARHILDAAASDLAEMVAAVARALGLAGQPFALGLAGGVLLRGGLARRLEAQLHEREISPATVHAVSAPVAGAVQLASQLAQGVRL